MLRPLYTYSLLALLLFQAVGYWMFSWAQIYSVRTEMSARLRRRSSGNEHMLSLTYPRNEFGKQHNGVREFWFEGMLYDIKSSHIKGDSICLQLVHDSREQKLLESMAGLFVSSADAGSLPLQVSTAQFLVQVYLPAESLSLFHSFPQVPLQEQDIYDSPILASFVPAIASPPPRRLI